MKLAKIVMIVCVVVLIILAETERISILRRLGMGIPVSEYESQVSGFVQSLSFAPVGLGIGIALLVFPQHVLHWFDKLLGRVRLVDPPLGLIIYRLEGLFFIVATLLALWTTGKFLLQ